MRWPRSNELNPTNARVIVPLRYALLAGEGSLLSGGSSTVVGKVVRVLRPPAPDSGRPRPTDVCYQDLSALNTFQLREGRLPVEALPALRDIAGNRIDSGRLTRSAKGDTGAIAPGAVVVPVAIIRDDRGDNGSAVALP